MSTTVPESEEQKLASAPVDQTWAATTKMDRSLAHSLAFRATTSWASQILSWASFLIVARLLAPSDFGIAAMAGLKETLPVGAKSFLARAQGHKIKEDEIELAVDLGAVKQDFQF